jgi:tetratricopeptide (TPR) repeat protein
MAEAGAQEATRGRLGQPGAPTEERATAAPPKPSNRFLTIAIVLATLVAALGGFMLNRASAAASDAGDQAQQLALQGSASETSSYQQAETDYSQYLAEQALRAKAAREMLEAGYDQPGASNFADLYRTATAQAAQTAKALPSDMVPNLANGNPDPNFPYDFFAKRAWDGTYLQAKSDGYNDVAGKWSGLVDSYTAIVTMVAVALFLFGSAYVLYGRNRRLLSTLAIVLVAVGVAWGGGLVGAKQPGTPSDAAARDYANGVVALSSAVVPSAYQMAINDFTAAIKARPDFAQAYSVRATAEALRGSEQIGSGFISNVAPYWQLRSASDEMEAYQLGDHDAGQVWNVVWALYHVWESSNSSGPPPERVVSFARQGAALDPSNPAMWANLGLAELAEGQYGAAYKDYSSAITHALFSCTKPQVLSTCDHPQPPTSYGLQRAWLAGGMTGLVDLASSERAQHAAGLKEAITRTEGILMGSFANDKVIAAPSPSPYHFTGLSAFIDPNYLLLEVPVPNGVSPERVATLPVTVVWYERSTSSAAWNGIAETACWGAGTETCARYDQSFNAFDFTTQFLQDADGCFTNLQYMAQLYINGTLTGSVTMQPQEDFITTALSPALAKDMNTGICVPSSWQRQPETKVTLPVHGTSERLTGPLSTEEMSYASPDGADGARLLRLYALRGDYTGGPQEVRDLSIDAAEYAVDLFKGDGLPADFSEAGSFKSYTLWGDNVTDMMVAPYDSKATGTEALVGAAIIAPNGVAATAQTQDQAIASNVVDDYAIAVTIVYGTQASGLWSGDHSLGLQVFSSWALLSYG